ncbi:MAG: RloB family protein [Chloroflexota bacterium]
MPARRDFKRKSGLRDARLIIIAAEGQETEKLYFEGLKAHYNNPRVHVEIVERLIAGSDPEKVIQALDHFRSQYKLRKDYDQLWLVIDVDRWGKKLPDVARKCLQKYYRLAVSNPAFEIWLLLHVRSLDSYPAEVLAEFMENKKTGERTRVDRELLALLGSYNKTNPDMEYFAPRVRAAIQNARAADQNPKTRWPNQAGSRVYLLVEEIIPPKN